MKEGKNITKDEKAVELAALVKEMREAQTAFFRSKHRNHLDRSRMLESRVDEKVNEILDTQIKLF